MSRIYHLIALLFLAGTAHADLQADIRTKVTAARAILDTWHANKAQRVNRQLHIVYWTPSDREPATDYRQRLSRILLHIRKFYADEMERIGFGRRTINLQQENDNLVKIHLVKGAGPYAKYNVKSGHKIRQECLPTLHKAGIDAARETIVIFCNLGEWNEKTRTMRHRSPYYAGGSHRSGTAWQLDEPILDTRNLTVKTMMRDGQYGRISMGKHNTIFIGGIAHELGHALSLPHNRERPDERAAFGTALMGSGNRTYGDELRGEGKGSFLTLAHAMRLASHPQFSGSVKGLSLPARVNFSDFKITKTPGGFHCSGLVNSKIPVYALIAYADPEGGSDYDATTVTAVPDNKGRFLLKCTTHAPGKKAQLRVIACHVNGATSRKTLSYSVADDGSVDISGTKVQ
ncbi:MAG: hypothetical protein GY899_00865 [Verrucomicrobiaceae bacterium]|nr:hypothetical protein [Verrucomicrobiaceae bacterium]